MYSTTKEIAQKWGVSETWVTILCKQGRIPGVTKKGKRWCVPSDAKKPADARVTKTKNAAARFKFIDLFAGIGGFHQAMRYLGGECEMAAEINQECVKTYSLNFKTNEKNIRGDVNEIDPATIAPFDVLCAGFPCQPFSKAGAQKGFQDETRGNLFYKIMDILDGHPEVKFVILENVRNLADKSENWDRLIESIGRRSAVAITSSGQMLFLYRTEGESTEFDSLYSLHWRTPDDPWILRSGGVEYSFQLPNQILKIWLQNAVSDLDTKVNAIACKVDFLSNMVVYYSECGVPRIKMISIDQGLLQEALQQLI